MSYFKKSQEVISNWPFWIAFTIAVAGVGLAIVAVANVDVEEASKIQPKIEDELVLIPRFYNSEDCFAYQGESEKIIGVHTRVIDPIKFTEANLDNKCFPVSNVNYAFLLSLEVPEETTLNKGPIATFNWVEGIAPKTITEEVFVFDRDEGIKYNAKLVIGIKNV